MYISQSENSIWEYSGSACTLVTGYFYPNTILFYCMGTHFIELKYLIVAATVYVVVDIYYYIYIYIYIYSLHRNTEILCIHFIATGGQTDGQGDPSIPPPLYHNV